MIKTELNQFMNQAWLNIKSFSHSTTTEEKDMKASHLL